MLKPRNLQEREPLVGLADQAVARSVGLVTTILLVRSLGLATFGAFALANLVALGVLAIFQALCVQPLAAFAQQEQGADRAQYLATARWIALPGALLAGLVAALVAALFLGSVGAGEARVLLPAVALSVLGRGLLAQRRAEAYATRQPTRALGLDGVHGAVQLGGLLTLHLTGHLHVPQALALQGFAALVSVTVDGLQGPALGRPKGLGQVLLRHWGHGRWLALMGLAQWGAANAYLVAAAALIGPTAAGAIRAAQTLVGAVLVLANVVDDQLPVRLAAERARGGAEALGRCLARWGLLAAAAALMAALTLYPLAGPLTRLVYGADQHQARVALAGLAWLPVGSLLFTVMQSAFRAAERTGVLSAVYLTWTGVALVVAEPIVARFGLVGATLGMSLQQLGLALSLVLVWGSLGWRGWAAAAPATHPT